MRLTEVFWRLLQFARVQRLRLAFVTGALARRYAKHDYKGIRFCTDAMPHLPELPFALQGSEGEIESWLDGEWHALGFDWRWTPEPAVWHKAPDTGRSWPETFFADITYREGNPFGDARVIWEPARLQQLVTLGLLARLDERRRTRAARMIVRQFESWLQGNSIGCGIHYVSAMECALRIIAVAYSLDIARDELLDTPSVWQGFLQLACSHADLVFQRMSLYSSSGNHTIAEGAGLVFAGLLVPEAPSANRWLGAGLEVLRREADRQVLADGGGIERSTWYHLFVIDLLGLVQELLVFKRCVVPGEIASAVTRGRKFLRALAEDPAVLPILGDADGGFALSRWLRLSFQEPHGGSNSIESFPDVGLTRLNFGGGQGSTLIFDHGMLGMEPSFGHGHADALSLLLTSGEQEILVDCGTFTYTGERGWRDYFRGTRAHNTVIVDGEDQARAETAFMWSRPFVAERVELETLSNDSVALLARHDGYRHLGVEHWRGIIFSASFLVVWDGIGGQGHHALEVNWHLGVDGMPGPGDGLTLDVGKSEVMLVIEGGQTRLCRCRTNPICGWRSEIYGRKQAITTVRAVYNGQIPHEFVSVFSLKRRPDKDVAVGEAVAELRRSAGFH